MSSAVSAGDLTLYRTHPQVANSYLWVDNPPIVYQGLVNQAAAFTYPIVDPVPIDNETGTVGDVQIDMLVTFGTSAGGDDLGRTRVLGITGTTLGIPRVSQGTVDGTVKLSDNVHFTIWDTYPPAPKIPFFDEATQTFFKDGDDVFVAALPPVANIGYAHIYADLVDGSDILTLTIDSTDSFSPIGGTLTRLWDVEDGTITVGSTSSTAITATFPVGRRWIKLTLTDTTNSRATIRHLLIVACKLGDATYAPIVDAKAGALNQTIEGLKQSFTFGQDIVATTYIDGVAVCYFQREFYGTTEDAIHDSTPVKFAGWHRTDPARIQAQSTHLLTEVTLDCVDTAGVLAQLPGFPQTIESEASPLRWEQMASPNLDKFLAYLWLYHSTASNLVDFTWSATTTTYPFVRLNALGNSLYGQIDGRARAIGYRLLSNAKGRCKVKKDSMLFDSGSRDSVNVISFTEADIVSINYTHQRPPRSHWNRGNAIVASSSAVNAVFCIAPGVVPSWGLSAGELGENLVVSQTELNTRVGHAYARENAPEGYVEVELLHTGDLGLEPLDFVRITLSSTYAAQRGLTWTTQRFAVVAINTDYDPVYGTKRVKLTLEKEVFGSVAETVTPDPSPIPDVTPVTDLYPVDETVSQISLDGRTVIAVATGIGLSKNYTSPSPTWENITGSGLTGTIKEFRLDPFASLLSGNLSGTLPAYCVTSTGVFYRDDMLDSAEAWVQKAAIADIVSATLRPSAYNAGEFYLLYNTATSGATPNVARHYSDYGATQDWTYNIGTNAMLTSFIGADIDPYGADEFLVAGSDGTNGYVYRILNGGAPSQLAGTAVDINNTGAGNEGGFYTIQKPFKTPSGTANTSTGASEFFVFSVHQGDSGDTPREFYKTVNGGTSITAITPSSGGTYYTTVSKNGPVFGDNPNVMIIVDNASGKLWTSSDGGANWTDRGGTTNITVSGYFPTDANKLYLGGTSLGYSADGGVTLEDKIGNFVSQVGSVSFFWNVIPLG